MNNFEFLVIGSNGLLGSRIVNSLKKKNLSFLTIARKNSNFNLNLENFKKINYFFSKNRFKIVINCAAIIDIEYCEKNFNNSKIINCKLVKFLSLAAYVDIILPSFLKYNTKELLSKVGILSGSKNSS